MLLVWGGLALVLIALVVLIPFDRLQPWVRVYVRVAIACIALVVVVALVA